MSEIQDPGSSGRRPETPKSLFLSHPADTLPLMPSQDVELSKRDLRVLDFEGSWWLYPQPKDRAITEYLDMSATRYYQVLRRLIDDELALDHSPLTVRRLRRVCRTRKDIAASHAGDSDGAS